MEYGIIDTLLLGVRRKKRLEQAKHINCLKNTALKFFPDIAKLPHNGWAIREGRHCYLRERDFDPPKTCARRGPLGAPIHDPIINTPIGP
jgi:hypothetical protein